VKGLVNTTFGQYLLVFSYNVLAQFIHPWTGFLVPQQIAVRSRKVRLPGLSLQGIRLLHVNYPELSP